MRIVTEQITIYKFDTAPSEVKEKIREYLTGDGEIYSHFLDERIDTLKEFSKYIEGELDYSISCVPDRGEFIKLELSDDSISLIKGLLDSDEDCLLTGVCYDRDLIDYFKGKEVNDGTIQECLDNYLKSIHNEFESMCEDAYLKDHCEANDYEFTSDGNIY